MFDKLIEFVKSQINQIIPVAVVFQFQRGIRLRYGKFHSRLDPGWHWKIPYVDTIMVEQAVDTTMLLEAQAVLTLDTKPLIVRGSIGYRIYDIALFYCSVWDTRSALADRTCVAIKERISENILDNCVGNNLDKILLKDVRRFAKNYGIDVFYVSLISITQARSLMLFNNSNILT